jgi:hypothetical protein
VYDKKVFRVVDDHIYIALGSLKQRCRSVGFNARRDYTRGISSPLPSPLNPRHHTASIKMVYRLSERTIPECRSLFPVADGGLSNTKEVFIGHASP